MSGDGNLSPWDAIPFFQPIKETFFSSVPQSMEVAPADPMRVGLIFSANGSQTIRISTVSPVTTASGILLSTTGFPLTLTHADFGVLVQQQWFGVQSQAGGSLTVIEVRMAKWPGEYDNAKALTPADIKRAALAYARAREVFAKQSYPYGNLAAER